MEAIVTRGDGVPGVEARDVKLARDIASQDITKLYLMSYYWTILAMTTVGNLPHPTTKVQYFYVIFQLLGGYNKTTRLIIPSASYNTLYYLSKVFMRIKCPLLFKYMLPGKVYQH